MAKEIGFKEACEDGARFGYGITLDNIPDLSLKREGQSDIRSSYQSPSVMLRVIPGF